MNYQQNEPPAAAAAAPADDLLAPALLSLPPDVITDDLLSFLPASSALNFGLTSKASFVAFNHPRHFSAALRRDFPKAAAAAAARSASANAPSPPTAKEQYYLQLSIVSGYDPRWYRLNTSGNDVCKSRQGFGKTLLLRHPVVYGGWATNARGFVSVDTDFVYLTQRRGGGGGGEYQWKKLDIANDDAQPQFSTYCTAATGVDDLPVAQLTNINGFNDLARARGWDVDPSCTFPVLFVSAGVVEGAYRGAFSFLHAIVGGTERAANAQTKGTDNDDDGDSLAAYDWCWLKVSGGVLDEIPPEERNIERARQGVSDAIPTGAGENETVTASASAFGGSARACHSLWYDRRLGCVLTFGGFTDTIARRACVEGGSFDEGSDRIGNPVGNLPEFGWSGHRALHHLEAYDLSKGRFVRLIQTGANPIARFGCTVANVTYEQLNGATYLVIGGCTGRHNHKGTMADGTDLQDPASHRILHLQPCSTDDSKNSFEIKAQWSVPMESERASLTIDSAHCNAALGRLHSSCAISEHGHLFFGGGEPSRLSSSLMLLKHGIKDAWSKQGVKRRWENWGRPLGSYHRLDGNTIFAPEEATWHFSRGKISDAGGSRLVPSPNLPRNDCLLVADANRPGEAFLWGGWRGEELGDCFKLVVGIPKSDEGVLYGNRAEATRRAAGREE